MGGFIPNLGQYTNPFGANQNQNAQNNQNSQEQQASSTSGFSIASLGNGTFLMTIDGKQETFNLADLELMVRAEQIEQYDVQIADQLREIQQTNIKRKALNELLVQMRKSKEEGRDDDSKDPSEAEASLSFSLPGYEDLGEMTVKEWMAEFEIERTDVKGGESERSTRDGQWEASINAVKTEIDNITSDSEMQMLRFRQLVDKRGTALQQARSALRDNKTNTDRVLN